ncbi:MAG TPA: hypothetical protein PKZ72_08190 [Saprospiraceae bacterium]|nr:hypothetical protein [Saprospiraceae bacterium]HMV22690.1 hypothetical protein [Saprospiraceae bacterium]HMX82126.1 hypothetical protein [Saprospiraceae bacterium]HNA40472.1 hypothetical protein [Saprospiraceae bacterium]HNA94673.1 hypothetical protein [Saprospiraceae bacterium]
MDISIKNSLLLICLYLAAIPVYAQKFYLSEPFRSKMNDDIELVGQQNGFVFFTQESDHDFRILRLNAELYNNRTLILPLNERKTKVRYTAIVDKMLTVVYSYRVKSELCIKIVRYDTDLNLRDSLTMACFGDAGYSPDIKAIPSKDKKTLVLYYIQAANYIQCYSFNLHTQKLNWAYRWDHTLEKTEYRYFEKILVDNGGNAVLIFNEPGTGKHDHNISCGYLTATGVVTRQFKNQPYNLYEADWLIDDKNQRLILAGMYSKDKSYRAEGVLYWRVRLPLDNDTPLLSTNPFNTARITGFESERNNFENGIDGISVVEILLKHDGGVVLILEKRQQNERNTRGRLIESGNTIRNSTDYYYDDVYICSVNANGTTDWLAPLAKKQFSQDDGADFSSFLFMKGKDYLRLVFNDEILNDNTISEYLIRPDGTFARKNIPNKDLRKLKIMFRKGKQVSVGSGIVPCYVKNKLRYLKIEY